MHAADDFIQQGRLARFEGRVEEALGQYQTAAELFREEDDQPRWANTMRYVAALEVELHRGEDARRDIETVLTVYSTLNPGVLELANATRVSALAAEACGETERAKSTWKEAADLYTEARLLEGAIEAAREEAMHAKETHTPEVPAPEETSPEQVS